MNGLKKMIPQIKHRKQIEKERCNKLYRFFIAQKKQIKLKELYEDTKKS